MQDAGFSYRDLAARLKCAYGGIGLAVRGKAGPKAETIDHLPRVFAKLPASQVADLVALARATRAKAPAP